MATIDNMIKWTKEESLTEFRLIINQFEKAKRHADEFLKAVKETPIETVEHQILLTHFESAVKWLNHYAKEAENHFADLRTKVTVAVALQNSKKEEKL